MNECGFVKYDYDADNERQKDDYYWSWEGESAEFYYNCFVELADEEPVETPDGEERHIKVEKLDWVETLFMQLSNNPYYIRMVQLANLDINFFYEYRNALTRHEKADFRLAFYVPGVEEPVRRMLPKFLEEVENGYAIVDTLHDAYLKMKEDELEEVILYSR